MKIKPEILFTINEDVTLYKKILVTGLDLTLLKHVTEFIINQFKNKKFFIDTSGEVDGGVSGNLFSDKKVLFMLNERLPTNVTLKNLDFSYQSVLISSSNTNKIKNLKQDFLKSKESLLIECYALNRVGKELILRDFVEKNNIKLYADVFWYILESFENEYVLLNKQLISLSLYSNMINSIKSVDDAILTENKIEINKLFFEVFKNNKTIVNVFNHSIYSQADFYIFLNSLKLYIGILASSLNKADALKKFPRYLFNEKDIFIKIYDKLNKKKILKLYKNIFRIEKIIRKNPSLYFITGLRFFLNTKKIITS